MRFSFDKKSLETIVKHLSLIVDKKAKGVFNKVKIEARGKDVFLYTTNKTEEFTFYCENVIVLQEGSILCDCHKLKEVLIKIESGRYTFEKLDDQTCLILNDDSNFEFKTIINKEDDAFPIFETSKSDSNFLIRTNELKDCLEKTIFATRDEPSKYQMNGILIKGGIDGLEFVSTDTKRLSIAKFSAHGQISHLNINFLIDPDFVRAVLKILPKEILNVLVQVFEKKIQINFGNCVLKSDLVEGIFPDYTKAIPVVSAETQLMTSNKGKLCHTLGKALPFMSGITKSVFFKLERDLLTIIANSGMTGYGVATFKIRVIWNHEPLEMQFNPEYFIEALAVIKDEPVDFLFNGPKRPVLIITKEGFKHLIMPVLARD